MKSQINGAAHTFKRSARLKKCDAFNPFTSARPSSEMDTEEKGRNRLEFIHNLCLTFTQAKTDL